MPAGNSGAAPQGDPFAEFVNKHNYIPVWLHPHVAAGVIRHFGRDGSALVHPHPHTTGTARPGMATGGVAPMAQREVMPPAAAPPPTAAAAQAPQIAPLAGIPPALGGNAGRSIFAGGPMGANGPAQRIPIFAQEGAMMDGTDGAGRVPGVDMGHDSVHAMLEPGEAVFNKKQLRGIQPKPGKEHLLRADQKKAMRGNASRV